MRFFTISTLLAVFIVTSLTFGDDLIKSSSNFQIQQSTHTGRTRIMLLGDSIADGKFADDEIGFRKVLFDRLKQSGHDIDFVGEFGEEPYEGHFQGSMKISDFYPRNLTYGAKGRMDVTYYMNTYKPNLVAIHLGTNDLNGETGAPISPYTNGSGFAGTQAGEMATLINYLLQWNNGQKGTDLNIIVVGLIIPIKYQDSVCVEFNSEVARAVRDFQNGVITGKPEPVYLSDIFSRFREWPKLVANGYKPLMYDKLHPTTAGHNLMGDTFFNTISPLLNNNYDWFTEITWKAAVASNVVAYDESGIANFENQGIAVADVNNDENDDIYLSQTNSQVPKAQETLFISNEALPFLKQTQNYNIMDQGGSRGIVFVDIDNDGDFDLFNGNSSGRNRLYENIGGRYFNEVTESAGIANLNRLTTGVVAFDCDNDDDMDLYAVNSREKNELYLNNGSGHFQLADRGADDSDEPNIPSLSASAADYDNDGDVDIYITKRGAANKLYRNDGTGFFSDAAQSAGVNLNDNSNGAVWSDLDSDGDLDLLVSTTKSAESSHLYCFENKGSGIFTDRTLLSNIAMDGYSPVVADFDNDGDDDFLVTNEETYAVFYRNEGNWYFRKIENTGAEILAGDIRGAATLDYDDDGDIDFITARADWFNVFMQNNLANQNHFLKMKVFGPKNNKGGYGTKIWLFEQGHVGDFSYLLGYKEIVSTSGHISQNSTIQHFGLGQHGSCDLLAHFSDGTLLVQRQISVDQMTILKPELIASENGYPDNIEIYSGDAQTGVVGQSLDDPVVVQVTNSNGGAVEGANVTFDVVQGDAQLFLPQTFEEKIGIEPEVGMLQGTLHWAYDESASGQGFVMIPPFLNGEGAVTIQHDVSIAGDYFVWIRVENAEITQSMTIDVDDVWQKNITINNTTGWQWIKVSQEPINLTKGNHAFRISFLSKQLFLDKMLLVKDKFYIPSGLEETNQSTQLTDRQGLARRFVQFGQVAGKVKIQANLQINGTQPQNRQVQFSLLSTSGPAVTMEKTAGDNQTGRPRVPLPDPFIITLYDAFLNRVVNAPVRFTILSGGGYLTTDVVIYTDSLGQAKTTLVPGDLSSTQLVKAEVSNVSNSPQIFTVTVQGVAKEMQFVLGDGQTGTVMNPLSQPVIVKILVEDDKPAENFYVKFIALDEKALVSSSSDFSSADSIEDVLTDSNGNAMINWRLGKKAGVQKLKIDAGSLTGSPLIVEAVAHADRPVFLSLAGGNNQQGVAGQLLNKPFHVRLVDKYGNPNKDQLVYFKSAITGGSFSGREQISVLSDSAGDAKSFYTLGSKAGSYKVAEARAFWGQDTIPGSPVEFYATVSASNAAYVHKVGGDGQTGIVNQELDNPFEIKITDLYNNPVANYKVTFHVVDGNGTLQGQQSIEILTDGYGVARAQYKLGTRAGVQTVKVLCPNVVPQEIQFSVIAYSSFPHELIYISGNNQNGAVNTTLREPLVVQVIDEYENLVPDYIVEFTVTSQYGHFNGQRIIEVNTDATGNASAYLTLESALGDSVYVVSATCRYLGSNINNSPIIFYASANVGNPHTINAITKTNGLVGAPNFELADSIVVQVVDINNYAIFDFPVEFRIKSGSGDIAGESRVKVKTVLTDKKGKASVRWILGGAGENHQLMALALFNNFPLENSPITFFAQAIEPSAFQLVQISGNNQNGAPGFPLAQDFVVAVTDPQNIPVANHPVIFNQENGDGYFQESNSSIFMTQTDSMGLAKCRFVLGQSTGERAYSIRAESFDSGGKSLENSPVYFYAHGISKKMVITSGDGQKAVVNTVLPIPFELMILDHLNNGVSGVTVTFESQESDGEFLGETTLVSDESGKVSIRYKLGKISGLYQIKAQAPSIGSFADFWITGLPEKAQHLEIASGNNQTGIAGHVLNQKIAVYVQDRFGNHVPGTAVEFVPWNEHGYIIPQGSVLSDSSGTAAVEWHLGTILGQQFVNAVNADLENSPLQFSAFVLQNQAPFITVSDSFLVNENENLSFVVAFSDAENDSIFYTVSNLPSGAVYDFLENKFSWTPTFDQAGEYYIFLDATDPAGARRTKVIRILVKNVNRAPQILYDQSYPLEHQLGKVQKPAFIDFSVKALDPDADVLNYLWRVNDQARSTSMEYRLQTLILDPGTVKVEAFVFDGNDTTTTSWTLEVITVVELSYFKAEFEKNSGVMLFWKTKFESDNLGFYVERSMQKDGPFEIVSDFLPANSNGDYLYNDEKISSGQTHFYRLRDVASNGYQQIHDAISIVPPVPTQFSLSQNYPNPFNPETTIRFDVAERSKIELYIVDTLGRQVCVLLNKDINPGFHKVVWHSTDSQDVKVASGIYYVVFNTIKGRFVKKMVLLH